MGTWRTAICRKEVRDRAKPAEVLGTGSGSSACRGPAVDRGLDCQAANVAGVE